MSKRIVFLLLSILCISMYSYGIDAWIRINQLGYLPASQKKAVFISETPRTITQFSIHDALTNEELGVFSSIAPKGEFLNFKNTYILDFSDFHMQGAFYIKAGLIYSPTIYINKNVYLGTADFLLNYIRKSRILNDSTLIKPIGIITTGEKTADILPIESIIPDKKKSPVKSKKTTAPEVVLKPQPKTINIQGGWSENADYTQYGATTANAVFQMLFAYQLNPTAFADEYNSQGKKKPNNIPDILDEAKWGLDWLLKMYPQKDSLFLQTEKEQKNSKVRSVYLATGKPQENGLNIKNSSTGLASLAGKYASAFAMGANVFTPINPSYADSLTKKAFEAYELGQSNPGVCQSIPDSSGIFFKEDNWTDDMELAATQLYRLTYKGNFLRDAAGYGRMEPITPWLCSDTASYYQWFPFINPGHYMLANVENPRYQKEFLQNMINGIQRMNLQAKENTFNIGVPMIQGSNNLVTALATQCRLYRTITGDSTYLDMETSLVDWLFGSYNFV